MRHLFRAALTAIAVLGWNAPALAADPQCGQNVMKLALEKCNTDIACMNAFVAQHKAKCAKQAAKPAPPKQKKQAGKPGQSLQDRLNACGMDVTCMNKVMQSASGGGQPAKNQPKPAKSAAGQPKLSTSKSAPKPPGGPKPQPDLGKLQQSIQACGGNSACVEGIMKNIQKQFDAGGAPPPGMAGGAPIKTVPEGDATWRISEGATILPRSWLQMFQNALVACGDDRDCWSREYLAGSEKLRGICGRPQSVSGVYKIWVCMGVGSNELGIEQALAKQRLARQEAEAANTGPDKPVASAAGGQARKAGPGKAPASSGGPAYKVPLPKVSESEIRTLIARWRGRMALRVPKVGRDKISAAVAKYPKTGAAKPAPLVFEERKVNGGSQFEIRPTRRDWAYAYNGTMLTMAAFIAQGPESRKLLDAAFWSFLRAAEINLESEHLSNIGFHLNLRAKLKDARKVLSYVVTNADGEADAHNNLAFTLAASGQQREAAAEQAIANSRDPASLHIRQALSRMSAAKDGKGGKVARPKYPPGYDYGEAFFRFGKRQVIREAKVDQVWREDRRKTWAAIEGGMPPVAGPFEQHRKRTRNIADDLEICINGAPPVLSGCPFGSYIVHPSCKNSPTPAQVAYSRRVHEAVLCGCRNAYAETMASAMNAYIDGSADTWKDHVRKWHGRLRDYATEWSAEIRALNARYYMSELRYPVEGNYTNWIKELDRDSEKFWGQTYPGLLNQWKQLRSEVLQQESCIIPGPPPPPKQKRPTHPKKPRYQKTFVMNLIVSSLEYRADGTAKIGFDLGFIKGSYEELPGNKGWRAELGSGPVDLSYEQYNKGPQPKRHPRDGLGPPGSGSSGDDFRIGVTVGVNASKFVPGPVKPITKSFDEVLSIGAKFNASWGNQTGLKGGAVTEAKPKFQLTSTNTPIPAYTRLQN